MMFFASLIFEREPMQWAQMPAALAVWLQNAGGVAAFGIAIVVLAGMLSRDTQESPLWNLSVAIRPLLGVLRFCIIAAAIGYAALLLIWLGDLIRIPGLARFLPRSGTAGGMSIGDWVLTLCGAIAIFVAVTPIAFDLLTRITWGRIWAIARLSWKEAIRGRVIWVFGAMALVFLFADWFVAYKPEDQLRNYVRVVYWSMTPLFLLTAGLLGSFSIPNDVKNNSIHTIVTKPVEKFEIVLGRFLGYAGLLTVGLFAVAAVSLLYVVRGVNEQASRESYRARVPVYGKLHFVIGAKTSLKGDNVGREWTHRGYFTGPTRRQRDAVRQYAIWDFPAIPSDVVDRPNPVVFEYAFDIFRLSKGEVEGAGVNVTFTFTDGTINNERIEFVANQLKEERDKRGAASSKELEAFGRDLTQVHEANKNNAGELASQAQAAVDRLKNKRDEYFDAAVAGFGKKFADAKDGADRQKLLNLVVAEAGYVIDRALAVEFRMFQVRGMEVIDYHTLDFTIPPGILKILLANLAERRKEDPAASAMRVLVSADVAREAQMIGVAQHDFYLLSHELPFWQNFLKGIVGMWCTHMLVLGVAVACSTYLSSVISFLGTMFLYVTGLNVEYLKEIAEKRVDGGGPMESMIRISTRMPVAAKLDDSPTRTLVSVADDLFSWWIGRILNLIPDVGRHDLHQYVAGGFDIAWLDLLLLDNILPVAAYLVPWAIVAYYLMKYREIANPQ